MFTSTYGLYFTNRFTTLFYFHESLSMWSVHKVSAYPLKIIWFFYSHDICEALYVSFLSVPDSGFLFINLCISCRMIKADARKSWKTKAFYSVCLIHLHTQIDKLITANIQLCKLCLLVLLAVAFLKALQMGGNKSDNDQRGIPPPRSRVEVASNREVKKLLFHPQRQM